MGLVISILFIWITIVRKLLLLKYYYTILIKIIITVTVVHVQNELNQKRPQYTNWS